MTREKIERLLQEVNAVRNGHFLLASGLHSGIYFEKFRLLEYPTITEQLCKEIAAALPEADLVAGPTTGGVIVAYEVARHLGVRCIFAEKAQDGRDFYRGFEIHGGEKVLVVDDVMTTGGSILDTLAAVERCGGTVVGVGVLIDRSSTPSAFDCPFFSVYKKEVTTYTPEDCPLCQKGIELEKPGGKR